MITIVIRQNRVGMHTVDFDGPVTTYFIFLAGIVYEVRGHLLLDTTISGKVQYFRTLTTQVHRYDVDC